MNDNYIKFEFEIQFSYICHKSNGDTLSMYIKFTYNNNRVSLIYTYNIYTIIVRSMTHVQKLDFKFKFYVVVIHPTLAVYTLSI